MLKVQLSNLNSKNQLRSPDRNVHSEKSVTMANDAIHGRRPIPNEIDNIAAKTPTKVYAKIPVDDQDLARGYRDISIKQLANAVNSASFWLDEALGETRSFAYYGARDLRYAAIILAAAKTGRKVPYSSCDI